ncbi:MAG: hypothetical protein Q4D91_08690 [Lautropia sp.]|nr:hypothetical protein [Lautropia sp.]
MAEDVQMLGGFQQVLLWAAMLGVVLACVAILVVTIRHRLLRARGPGAAALSDAHPLPDLTTDARRLLSPVAGVRALLAEVFWVLLPMAMVVGLGAWVMSDYLGHLP